MADDGNNKDNYVAVDGNNIKDNNYVADDGNNINYVAGTAASAADGDYYVVDDGNNKDNDVAGTVASAADGNNKDDVNMTDDGIVDMAWLHDNKDNDVVADGMVEMLNVVIKAMATANDKDDGGKDAAAGGPSSSAAAAAGGGGGGGGTPWHNLAPPACAAGTCPNKGSWECTGFFCGFHCCDRDCPRHNSPWADEQLSILRKQRANRKPGKGSALRSDANYLTKLAKAKDQLNKKISEMKAMATPKAKAMPVKKPFG